MDKALAQYIHENLTPKINPIIANGLATHHVRYLAQYVDKVIKSAAEGFPPRLKYVGMESCTPDEHYDVITRKKTNRKRKTTRSEFETAETHMYMIKILFEWDGKPLRPRYLLLPYLTEGGMLRITGSLWAVYPILADRGFSIGNRKLFIPLTGDKQTFERILHQFTINQHPVNEMVAWSEIHNGETAKGGGTKPKPSLIHYLFCKFGVVEAIRRYTGVTILLGDSTTITETKYPSTEWNICKAHGKRPWGSKNSDAPISDIRIAVKVSEWSNYISSLVAGFFYVLRFFSDRISPEYIHNNGTVKAELNSVEDETRLWRVLLGQVLWGSSVSEGLLEEKINKHIRTCDGYVDELLRDSLARDEIFVEDYYHLLAQIIESFSWRIAESAKTINNMYDKRLTVLRYIALPITSAIFKARYRLTSTTKPLNLPEDVETIFNKHLFPELMIGINTDHGEVRSISCSSDNRIFGITKALVSQRNSSGNRGKDRISLDDPTKFAHVSIAEVGSYLCPQKSDPTGQQGANPMMVVDPEGLVLRHQHLLSITEATQEKIKR